VKNVYWIRQSIDDEGERPDVVTYNDPEGWFRTSEGFKEYQTNACVSAGKAGYRPGSWRTPDLCATEKGRTSIDEWDYYSCATFGAFSDKAMSVLEPFLGNRFLRLPARLEGHDYWCLRCEHRTDCLDKTASEITFFDFDPKKIMKVVKYRFRKKLLATDMIFAIPELEFHLFCTDAVPDKVVSAMLRGIEFELVDDNGGPDSTSSEDGGS